MSCNADGLIVYFMSSRNQECRHGSKFDEVNKYKV